LFEAPAPSECCCYLGPKAGLGDLYKFSYLLTSPFGIRKNNGNNDESTLNVADLVQNGRNVRWPRRGTGMDAADCSRHLIE